MLVCNFYKEGESSNLKKTDLNIIRSHYLRACVINYFSLCFNC